MASAAAAAATENGMREGKESLDFKQITVRFVRD